MPVPPPPSTPKVQQTAAAAIRNGALVVAVRTPEEYHSGHIDGALNIPHDQIAVRIDEMEAHRHDTVILYCRSGRRSGIAHQVLVDHRFTGSVNAGGFVHLPAELDQAP